MISSSLYSFIVAEFSKKNTGTSLHYIDMPSYEDVDVVLKSVVEWAKQNNKLTEAGTISIDDLTE